jgi:hypothetical protein
VTFGPVFGDRTRGDFDYDQGRITGRAGRKDKSMYAIDLRTITLDEFAENLSATRLTPGRRVLLDNLAGNIAALKAREISDLGALRGLLRDKKRYPALAAELGVSVDYLTVLNREVNGYVAKPVPLAKLDIFSEVELAALGEAGITSTRHLWEQARMPTARAEIAARAGIAEGTLAAALELADLVRINGVGPAFAHVLRDMDIRSTVSFQVTDSEEIMARYDRLHAAGKAPQGPRLSIKDVEWCKRFCGRLAAGIEW